MVPIFTLLLCTQLFLTHCIRVAQYVLNVRYLPGPELFPSFGPSWWGNWIESPKKLVSDPPPLTPPKYAQFTTVWRPKNDFFCWNSNLTTLMTLNWSGNIGKHMATPKCPHQDPKSTKMEHSGRISALWMHLKSKTTWDEKRIFTVWPLVFDRSLLSK